MNTENIIRDVLAASRSLSQKGDVSRALLEQGFFDKGEIPAGLKNRGKQWSGGNPVDVKDDFNRQQQYKIKGD
ncbi:MAG: hypothetical protein PHF86_04165 [Candidatus Nanoarchaeia archaeon]|jgi:hypothetical protein|nr:hypothetical protein [Candidatus Nanoarchaeia archaeon]